MATSIILNHWTIIHKKIVKEFCCWRILKKSQREKILYWSKRHHHHRKISNIFKEKLTIINQSCKINKRSWWDWSSNQGLILKRKFRILRKILPNWIWKLNNVNEGVLLLRKRLRRRSYSKSVNPISSYKKSLYQRPPRTKFPAPTTKSP